MKLRPAMGRPEFFETCELVKWRGEYVSGTCHWCAGELTGRRRNWCSDECVYEYDQNHHWTQARAARIELDDYTCQRCGVVGWNDVPRQTLELHNDDLELYVDAPTRTDWAFFLGLVSIEDLVMAAPMSGVEWKKYHAARDRITVAEWKLPRMVKNLVLTEEDMRRETVRLGADRRRSKHDLEVHHVFPRGRAKGKDPSGCHHHLSLLVTLCRQCHLRETKRERRMQVTRRKLESERPSPRELVSAQG